MKNDMVMRRLKSGLGVRVLLGSGLFWAWLDALFMGAFFPEQKGVMPEACTMLVFSLSIIPYIIVLVRGSLIMRAIAHNRFIVGSGVVGTCGAILCIVSGMLASTPLLVFGSLLGGVFMGFLTLAWGGVYSKEGAASAMAYLAGGFAAAIVIDIPLLLMIPEGRAFSFALLPLASALCFASLSKDSREYVKRPELLPSSRDVHSLLRNYLGVQLSILCALCLVMFGFGYIQHIVSFSESVMNGGVVIQVVRGIVAIVLFGFIAMNPARSRSAYRIGLLAIIAGFMIMAFLYGTDMFWIPGAIFIGGYTVFDVLKWVAFSQIAYAQSKMPIKTIAVMRLADAVFLTLGLGVGLALNANPAGHAYSAQETMVVGYAMVIAIVLLLGSEDIWSLFRFGRSRVGMDAEEGAQGNAVEVWAQRWGLTQRETDVLECLAAGRTQPWIAENLSISESTVGTHVRHIYQKADVHGRQELLDCLVSAPSCDSHDRPEAIDRNA